MDNSHRKVLFSRWLPEGFKSPELEQLYRRYAVKLQQASTSSVLALAGALALCLGGAHAAARDALSAAYYLTSSAAFGVALLLLVLGRIRDARLPLLRHAALALCAGLCAAALPFGAGRPAAHGACLVLFVVFVAYGLLPLRTRIAVAVGLALPLLHTAAALAAPQPPYAALLWHQVIHLLFMVKLYRVFEKEIPYYEMT
ncbi:adenylate cyclase type 1-like [Uloborus diversus]|uniref:adenylate cyclase type 1-like n=1 Tax=Uloborus diversus TaxID=327109 RepID=UPI002409B029|nr:adenylate cyclase type 1-like [Uloborus diversus]